MRNAILGVFLLAGSMLAGDFTGKWSGTFELKAPDGQSRTIPAYMVLKQEGDKVTGTGGPNAEKQHPVEQAKVEGDKVTLLIDRLTLTLTQTGDELKGDVSREDENGKQNAVAQFKRVKE
jgi:hypothetical protein